MYLKKGASASFFSSVNYNIIKFYQLIFTFAENNGILQNRIVFNLLFYPIVQQVMLNS